MSSKIYNGFRFRSRSLLTVHRQVMGLRPLIHALQDAAAAAWLARTATRILDLDALGRGMPEPSRRPVLSQALDEFRARKEKVKKSGLRDPEVDLEFSLAVLPWRGRVYGMVFTEQASMRELLFAQDWVEEFPWWDNADRPDGVSAAAWRARARVWNDILSQDPGSRPSECGFGVDVQTPDILPSVESIVAAVESQADRAHKIAIERMGEQLLRQQRDLFEGSDEEWRQSVFSTCLRAMHRARSPDAAGGVATMASEIRGRIPSEITREMLTA